MAKFDWHQFSSDVKLKARATRPIHIKEKFDFGSQSTVMAIWQGKPVGVIPLLRVCQQLKINPVKYFEDE